GKLKSQFNSNFITPYILSPHSSHTLYLAGNYVLRSTNRGDSWFAVSEDLSLSADSTKKALAAGAIAESPLQKDLIYVGTDRGGFWVTENGGANWEERSSGLPNAYIRSIFPSNHDSHKVYISLNGMNYDDLSNHLYMSDDRGITWKSITANLPNETANVIYEDPKFPDVLYAGLYRGVYISLNRGENWQLLGDNLAATCIADIELKDEDLLIGTHGRGIYKMNIAPVYHFLENHNKETNYLFSPPPAYRPESHDTHKNINYQTVTKVPLTFWLAQPAVCTLKVMQENKTIWEKELSGQTGYNQYRWDLVVEKEESDLPYFIHYEKFISIGQYQLVLELPQEMKTDRDNLETELIVK
ncbi:MAG: hypothetical protein KDD99_20480, partial [Bacteroidetes bacterium]|nr:hypothetical protein [Bacteroidota bacterium]